MHKNCKKEQILNTTGFEPVRIASSEPESDALTTRPSVEKISQAWFASAINRESLILYFIHVLDMYVD